MPDSRKLTGLLHSTTRASKPQFDIELFGDSKVVFDSLDAKTKTTEGMVEIQDQSLETLADMVRRSWIVRARHVKRGHNKVVDALASLDSPLEVMIKLLRFVIIEAGGCSINILFLFDT